MIFPVLFPILVICAFYLSLLVLPRLPIFFMFANFIDLFKEPTLSFTDFSPLFFCFQFHWFLLFCSTLGLIYNFLDQKHKSLILTLSKTFSDACIKSYKFSSWLHCLHPAISYIRFCFIHSILFHSLFQFPLFRIMLNLQIFEEFVLVFCH